MRLLLDTHTFLWFIEGSNQLSEQARSLIEDLTNDRLLSTASLWEMAIKTSINKLELQDSFTDLVEYQIRGNAMSILPITPLHLDILKTLPFHHRDPFDRMIISQSLSEEIPILSKDAAFDSYGVERLWSQ